MPNTDDLIKIARRHQPFQDQPVRLLLLERFEVMARYPQIKGLDFHSRYHSHRYRNLGSRINCIDNCVFSYRSQQSSPTKAVS